MAVPRAWSGTSTFSTHEENKLALSHQALAIYYSSPRNLTQWVEDLIFGGKKKQKNPTTTKTSRKLSVA